MKLKSNFISIFLLFGCILANQNVIFKETLSNLLISSTESLVFTDQTIDDAVVTVALSFAKQKEENISNISFKSPLKKAIITNFFDKDGGIYIATFENDEVSAIADGKIISKSDNSVIIQHENGYVSIYENLSQITTNTQVVQGEIIGIIANSNSFKNSSMYFEITHLGKSVNPESVINEN